MSLINDMLQDLAARDAGRSRPSEARSWAQSPLSRVGSLPQANVLRQRRRLQPSLWLNGVLAMALVSVCVAWAWQRSADKAQVALGVAAVTSAGSDLPQGVASSTALAPTAVAAVALPLNNASAPPGPLAESSSTALLSPAQYLPATANTEVPTPANPATIARAESAPAVATDAPAVALRRPQPALASAAPETLNRPTPVEPPQRVAAASAPAVKPPAPSPVAAPDTLGVARQAGAVPTPPAASAQQLAQLAMPGAKASVGTKALPAPAAAAPASTTANESALQRAEEKYQQAMAEKGQGAKEVATRSLLGALDLAPQHVRARLALAGLLQELKQSGAAAEVLSDGLMLLPRQTSFMLALAPLWIQAGQQKDALAMLTQGAPHAAATDGAFHAYYGTQLLTQSRPAEAAQRFRQALTSAPGNGEWQLGLGLSLQATGNSREAIDPLQRASASGQLSPQAKGQVDQMIAKLQQQTP